MNINHQNENRLSIKEDKYAGTVSPKNLLS